MEKLPPLFAFRYTKTRIQVYTHRSYHARPTAVFEDKEDDIAPDNEVLEFVGDSVLSLAVATLVRQTYRKSLYTLTGTRRYLSNVSRSRPQSGTTCSKRIADGSIWETDLPRHLSENKGTRSAKCDNRPYL